jgi:hypothetical protein
MGAEEEISTEEVESDRTGENWIVSSFLTCTPYRIYLCDKVKKNEVSGACDMYGEEAKCIEGQ